MLLKALHDFAHRRDLLKDLAFAEKPVRWIIELDEKGNLLGSGPVQTGDGKRGKELSCPRLLSDSNSGTVAGFMVEAVDGMFALSPNPQKPKSAVKLAAKTAHFWQQIEDCQKATGNEELKAVITFGQSIKEGVPFLKAESNGYTLTTAAGQLVKVGNDDFSFSVGGKLILEMNDLQAYWKSVFSQGQSDDDEPNEAEEADCDTGLREFGVCLISGDPCSELARTHVPKIRGVPGAQGSGAKIVSFDKASLSYSSYGRNQSYNAPVSIAASVAYCVGLNWMLKRPDFHVKVGSACVVFWARANAQASSLFAGFLNQPRPETVRKFLVSPWAGIERDLAKSDEFYAVTLSGNSGRIVVKHWLQEPLESAIDNLHQWFVDLDLMVPLRPEGKLNKGKTKEDTTEYNPLSIYWLSRATLSDQAAKKLEKKLPPNVPAQLYSAAIEGTAPPIALLKLLLNQLHSKIVKDENYRVIWDESRFALLKLLINRHHRTRNEPNMELAPQLAETSDPAYNCGRLLSVFDALQRAAHRAEAGGGSKLNTTLAERYFGAASSNPNGAFSLMWRLHMHHLKKLRQKGEKGQRAAAGYQRSIMNICRHFTALKPCCSPQFPRVFTLVQQGRFALGYYQQEAHRAEQIRLWKERQAAAGKTDDIDADEPDLAPPLTEE